MTENLRDLVLGVLAAGVTTALGWSARALLSRRALRRTQRFFGLPEHATCLLVVNQDAGTTARRCVAQHDVFALLELAALIRQCGAHMDLVAHDGAQQGFGERTEFCIGGPYSNHRTAAHLDALLPGVAVRTEREPREECGKFTVAGQEYALRSGEAEYVLLARLTTAEETGRRPLFLVCGQRAVTNQAGTRYLARHHRRLARRHGAEGTFCLLLKVVNSRAYGPDVVEVVADVTRAATTAPPAADAG
jgi:hypothetical protein